MNASPLDFLKELIKRFGQKSPKFFQIINWVSAIATFIVGLPLLITQFGIVLPDWAMALTNKTVAFATLVAFIISKLTVDTTVMTPTKTDNALPFTTKTNNSK